MYTLIISHSHNALPYFFKTISRLGDGPFWYVMLLSVWIAQGLAYGLQILYLLVAGSVVGDL